MSDLELVGRILRESGFRRFQEFRELPAYWQNAVPKDYPPKGELDKRVQVPSFYGRDSISVAISWAGSSLGTFGQHLKETFVSIEPEELAAVGLIADAEDNEPKELLEREIGQIRTSASLPFPREPRLVSPGPPRLGTFLSPGLGTGTVEDLLIDCASLEFPDLLALANRFVLDGTSLIPLIPELKALGRHSGPEKATVSAMASLLKPGKSVHTSIADHRWISERTLALPGMALLKKFLEDLLAFR